MFATLCLITFSANAQTKKGTVLLGAGSDFSGVSWTDWSITPKIGYFIQDGLAIGAMVHFSSNDEYSPAFAGDYVVDVDDLDGDGDDTDIIVIGEHDDYTLTDNKREFGVFARYYAARNLFIEVSLSSMTSQDDSWGPMTYFNALDDEFVTEDMVLQSRMSSSNVRFGMGYTLVWREHFAIEPFVHLDLVVDGEMVQEGLGTIQTAKTSDLSGSEFIGGVNFSLFF